MDKLLELIASGPNPKYTMKSLVLERYHDILQARRLMRTWADISEALGIGRARWKDVSMSFRRVDAGVKAGKLMPGKPGKTVVTQQQQRHETPQPVARRPLPGQIPVGDAEAIVDAVEAKLGANFFK